MFLSKLSFLRPRQYFFSNVIKKRQKIVERRVATQQTMNEPGTIKTVAIENVALDNVATDKSAICKRC